MLYVCLVRPAISACMPSGANSRPRISVTSRDEGVPLLTVARQARFDQVVVIRIELHEREVLELPLDFPDTETMRERRVDVEGLAADAQPALGGVPVDRAHVVEPVTELDEHHAHVLGHGHEHLADVLGLVRLGAAHVDLAELGDAVDELRDLVAEEGCGPPHG